MDNRYNFIPVWLSIGTKRTKNDSPLEQKYNNTKHESSTKRTKNDSPLELVQQTLNYLSCTNRTRYDKPLEQIIDIIDCSKSQNVKSKISLQ